ncbi:DUF2231 domain-containing protein [Georgenia sp. AZ-5]|uniref:DUF2231 domain-containing protein n=1 Tax=Georgenia sp. AZ-5 TaxID=3367526 RepID=UPI00375448CE
MTTTRSSRRTPPLVKATRDIEEAESLDRVVEAVQPLARALVANPGVAGVLHGRQLGHALHPLLTDLPIGLWASATALDLLGGEAARPAASRLVGLGLLAAVPTVVTGLAEWAVTDRRNQRVGITHATANTITLGLQTASWLNRRAGWRASGVALSLAADLMLTWGGYLGAHMSLARKVATRDPAFEEGAAARRPGDLGKGGPAVGTAGDADDTPTGPVL